MRALNNWGHTYLMKEITQRLKIDDTEFCNGGVRVLGTSLFTLSSNIAPSNCRFDRIISGIMRLGTNS